MIYPVVHWVWMGTRVAVDLIAAAEWNSSPLQNFAIFQSHLERRGCALGVRWASSFLFLIANALSLRLFYKSDFFALRARACVYPWGVIVDLLGGGIDLSKNVAWSRRSLRWAREAEADHVNRHSVLRQGTPALRLRQVSPITLIRRILYRRMKFMYYSNKWVTHLSINKQWNCQLWCPRKTAPIYRCTENSTILTWDNSRSACDWKSLPAMKESWLKSAWDNPPGWDKPTDEKPPWVPPLWDRPWDSPWDKPWDKPWDRPWDNPCENPPPESYRESC